MLLSIFLSFCDDYGLPWQAERESADSLLERNMVPTPSTCLGDHSYRRSAGVKQPAVSCVPPACALPAWRQPLSVSLPSTPYPRFRGPVWMALASGVEGPPPLGSHAGAWSQHWARIRKAAFDSWPSVSSLVRLL